MRVGILGHKVGMTQIFDEVGNSVPVTVIDTSGCVLSQIKQKPSDQYVAVQVAIGDIKPQNIKKSQAGHFKKAGVAAKRTVCEFRLKADDDVSQLKAGQQLSAAIFTKGDLVDVTATTKGKGFQGVMKRYGFKGKDATHGTHEYFRHGGSLGANTFPGRVIKNKKMPGQTGNVQRTTLGLQIVDVDPQNHLLLVRGSVPGPRNSVVRIRTSQKDRSTTTRSFVQAQE